MKEFRLFSSLELRTVIVKKYFVDVKYVNSKPGELWQ